VACYIRSFLPLTSVADNVQLALQLGTLYRLQSLQLQRLGDNGFQTIQTLNPVTQLATTFTDPTATTGLNRYRLLGQDMDGRTFLSQEVDVQLVSRGELLVFPNPVIIGQELQIAGEPNVPLQIELYDALGRLVRSDFVQGALNPFDTSALHPGVYLLRATPTVGGGPARTRRVILTN
jgi:hypothetical protein